MYQRFEKHIFSPLCVIIPWVLTLIFSIVSFVFCILYVKTKNSLPKKLINPYHYIPITESVFDSPENGAYKNVFKYDNLETNYYPKIDFYNLKSTDTLSILENFMTYQQTSEFSCGCSCVIMSLYYLGKTKISERECVKKTNSSSTYGCDPANLEKVIIEYGFDYESSRNFTEENNPTNSEKDFEDYVESAIKSKEPVIVLSADWGGHYLVIIGIDKVGKDINNHVFIMADPYDTTDHIQDGYNVWGVERFYYTMMFEISNYNKTFQFIRVKRKK